MFIAPNWQAPAEEQAGALPPRHRIPRPTETLTVSAAYAEIPHRRTPFRPNEVEISDYETEYLQLAFATINQGIVQRVAAVQAFRNGDFQLKYVDDYLEVAEFFRSIQAPDRLAAYHAAVAESMTEQIAFLQTWQSSGPAAFGGNVTFASEPAVLRASEALKKAHAELLRLYPNVSDVNRDAFFDHHCALDFI